MGMYLLHVKHVTKNLRPGLKEVFTQTHQYIQEDKVTHFKCHQSAYIQVPITYPVSTLISIHITPCVKYYI